MKKRHQQKLVFLSALLFVLWNVPFVSIYDGGQELLGFPSFYLFIFFTWFVAIVVAFIILKIYYE